MTPNTNFLKKIDWRIVTFLLSYMYHNPNQKRTNLSMKTGLNYTRFMRYIRWLQFVDWVRISESNANIILNLTPQGRIMAKKIQEISVSVKTSAQK